MTVSRALVERAFVLGTVRTLFVTVIVSPMAGGVERPLTAGSVSVMLPLPIVLLVEL